MGIASMEELMEICKSEELKAEMSRQLSDYNVLAKECEMLAKAEGLDIKDNNWFDKTMLYSSIKMKTCFNKSEENIAEMLIVGSTMGVIDVIKMKTKLAAIIMKFWKSPSNSRISKKETFKN